MLPLATSQTDAQIAVAALFLVPFAVVGAIYYFRERPGCGRWKKQPTAIGRLQKDPAVLQSLRAKAHQVCVVKLPDPASRLMSGARYESFVIDKSGDPHTLERGKEKTGICQRASWVAQQLGVPLADLTGQG